MNKIILLILIFIIGLTSQVTFANTFTVTNNADSEPGSLRDAITNVLLNDGDIIQFNNDYTINLTSGELAIGKSITIDGYNHKVTVIGGSNFRVFNVNSGVTVTLKNLTIQNGNAENGGGIFSDGLLTINNCTITGNAATNNGGGIYINSGTVTINNSTISAQNGGGGIFNKSNVVINNSTLSGNNGGGIYNNGTLELKNTIIANSTGGDCSNSGSITSTSTNNLIRDNSCNPKLSGDPQLGPLQDNGSPTPTHALLDGSPAIGAGNPATCLLKDQRGKTRDLPLHCDIGAFEFNHAPIANDATFTTTTNTNLSNTLSATDADGDSLTYSIDNSSSLGTVTLTDSTTGAFTYTPPSNETGTATFTYKVKDNAFDSKEAVKTVTIKIVNNIVVDNAGDKDDGNVSAGQNTLREAITHALSGDMITFANSLANQTITIDKKNVPLVINKDLIIDGAGQNITLSGGNNNRLFQIDSGNVTINHLTMRDSKSADGGAIHVNSGALFLNDCTIANNKNISTSHQGGGLFIGTGAVVEINRCLIDSNSANGDPGHGGGIFNQGKLTLNNSTVANNDANKGGGGLYNESGASAEINNSTFSANFTAQQNQGSNLYNGGTLKLRNTILANSGKNGGDCTNAGTINPNLNNLIEDGTCSSATNLTGDPKLIGLQPNGTFALSDGSPAIDAGDNSTCLATDQLGKLRPIDGNNDSSAICDIGAVEKDPGVVPQPDIAPSVISTDPTGSATGIDPTAAVTINFSESVNATVSSFSFECPAGTAILFNLSASPATTFTLTPTSNLPFSTSCQVTVKKSGISDVDNIDPPDLLSGDYPLSFQTANPPPTIPSPPTNLKAVPTAATETMGLSWNDNSDNETGFKIVRDGKLLSTTAANTTTYQDSPLKCGTEYTYSVTAINAVGDSSATTLTVSTWDCPPPSPTNLQAVPIVATQTMKLSWTDNSDNEIGFKIARDGKPLSTTTAANITTYQDSPLKCGTEYTYSVTAINTVGESTAATITVSTWDCPTPPPIIVVGPDPLVPPTDNTTTPPTTDQPPIVQPPTTANQLPIAPIKLNVVATSPTEVTLTWNDTSHNETGFKIERNNILTQITAANVTTYKDTELTCNTTYNYIIKATNASGDSAALTASITTPICATKPLVPSNLKVIATSPTAVNLSWADNSDNETGFKIERDGTVVHMSLATVTSYQDNGLTCGTPYHYQVIATNAIGDSVALTQTITTLPCTSTDSLPSTPMSLEISFIGDGQAQIKTYAAEIACDSSKAICTHDVKVPTSVILVATAAKGSQFFAWEGDCQSKSDSIEFILNTDRHCIVHFEKVADVPKDNTNNTSDSKDHEPCLVNNSLNCNPLPPVNHPPTDIILSNQRIDENSPGGTFIGRLTTLDSDVNEAHQYTLLDDASHTFILQSDELHLAQHAQLDFETAPSYTILVHSTDSQGAFIDKIFTIGVNNTDEAQFLGKVLTADWQVGKDMTIDEPETVNLIGYIKPQATHIGQIADIIATYDWTPAQQSQPALSIPITIAPQTLLQADMQFSLYEGRLIGLAGMLKITLGYQLNQSESFAGQIITLNINPNRPPTDIYLSNHTVMENSQPNTVIGWLATTDLDQQDQFTYGLVDNPGNYFTIVGNELRVNHFHFNYANGAIYPIRVRSVDMTGAYVDKSFTIEVTDTQSQLKDIQLTKTAVFENSPKGFIVGRLWIQGDEQSHYQYELIENAQGRFTLMNDLIVIAKDDELDFENQVAYPIVVRSTQTDTHQVLEKTFTIDILNVIDVTVRGELYDITHQSIDSSNLRSADKVIIELQLIPDQTHQGQLAVLFSVALWVADSGQTRLYIFNGDTWVEWNGDWATLSSVQPLILQDHHELTLWQDKLPNFSSGQFHIFGGYRLTNGEIVYSPKPFDISIP
ncbi:hypothetical protein THII_0745 [Thioploca ingrica]|uniref:Tandem-95 repeat protein n=1 Tax=Thioploca ingrica TaxID=40754 RepID=A0A090AI52_9GAMM|nr:hypothetical protein THII_0745 [Thioploca ingrica]